MTIKQQIAEELKKVLSDLGLSDVVPQVDYPADPKHGDYASNIALVAFKEINKDKFRGVTNIAPRSGIPVDIANQIKVKLENTSNLKKLVQKITVAPPGFINFFVADKFLVQKLQNSNFETWDSKDREKRGKVVVEYSSPNIAKPFTIGHLRSTIIGDAVANLLEAVGYEVYRDNHVGDWGTQFGKQIYAIKTWGDEHEIEKSERPVKILVDLYVKFHEEAEKNYELEEKAREWFKKLEDGDKEARRLWEKCIEWSWKEFDEIYKELGVPSGEGAEFENNGRGYGESYFEDKMQPVIDDLDEKGLLKVGKEGAKIIEFDPSTSSGKIKLPPLMILKKDGATLYSTRDLATDKFRLEKYGQDVRIINEVGAEQALYFQQLYTLEEMLGWTRKDQRVHLKHGLIRFKDGKMSTRKGNTIWLEDVLDEAEKRAGKLGESGGKGELGIAKAIGIGAIKWNDLKREPKQDIMFDWDEILNMQGNSGPYVQYTFARTQSVLSKAQNATIDNSQLTFDNLESEERDLLRLLSRFDEIVELAAERLAPNLVANYLFEVSQAFNLFYQKHRIINAEGESRDLRLFLTQKTGEVIKKGLNLLGIDAPEKM